MKEKFENGVMVRFKDHEGDQVGLWIDNGLEATESGTGWGQRTEAVVVVNRSVKMVPLERLTIVDETPMTRTS